MQAMVQRKSTMISLLVIVVIVVVAVAMYAAYGSQGGFVGVPRLLPGGFASGTTGEVLNTILYVLLMAALFVALGVIVYYARRLKD
jgi:ABC-type Fe3+ transport system permease subunit